MYILSETYNCKKLQSLTRADRKAAVAVLDIVPLPVCSDDMKELLEALEEPQVL